LIIINALLYYFEFEWRKNNIRFIPTVPSTSNAKMSKKSYTMLLNYPGESYKITPSLTK